MKPLISTEPHNSVDVTEELISNTLYYITYPLCSSLLGFS